MSPTALPATFLRTVQDVHGDAGAAWLSDLPAIIAACAKRWRLDVGPPYPLSYSYVARATGARGEACALKLGVPGDPSLDREATVLELAGGSGAVRLLHRAPDLGALLLERAEPGDPVPFDGDVEVEAAAVVLRNLWRSVPSTAAVPPVGSLVRGFEWYERHHGADGPLPEGLVDIAALRFAELLASSEQQVVLHGDLHHGNILSSERAGWLSIDPKGFVGDPAFDCAALVTNPDRPLAESGHGPRVHRLAGSLAAVLELDPERVRAWTLVRAVLSEIWFVEDHGRPHGQPLRVALAVTGGTP